MLQIEHIRKQYKTGSLVQNALNDVSLNLRDNEFVAILGPSGSGKTTLLNIIGGLDRYDSGDLIINGISTKKYTDRDWDSYRNHTIGFVFQSYNLIPHQTVLANVELALTISGISGAERKRRATEALEKVGLGNQLHKRPNEMSGGQMQRVAIARALVNNPDILLADEPTGALDSETSIQVMELLKEVANDRLVVMVTHNPELAEQYATRIVNLKDGVILSDSMPYQLETNAATPPVHKNLGKSSMSLLTSLSLSFNNLLTKKARTLLTAFAGSIGIIGIALILSLSNGVNEYIEDMERSTLSEYPLQIMSSGMDFTSMIASRVPAGDSEEVTQEGMVPVRQLVTQMVSGITSNDLESLKAYLDGSDSTIRSNSTAVEYHYSVTPIIYRVNRDGSYRKVNPDSSLSALGISSDSSSNSIMSSMMDTSVFYEMPETPALYETQYDVKAGRWPEAYNECILVLDSSGKVTDYVLYALGLRDNAELDKMIQQFAQNQNVKIPDDFKTYTYDDFLGKSFKLVSRADQFIYDETHSLWVDKSEDTEFMSALLETGDDLTIVGIVQPKENATTSMLTLGIGYTHDLTNLVIQRAANSEIVQKQLADSTTNVFTGEEFGATAENPFKMDSLFSVDTDALQNAFQFDVDSIQLDLSGAFDFSSDSFDFSNLFDPNDFEMSADSMPDMDLSSIFGELELSIPTGSMQSIVKKVLSGYKDYVVGNGILHLDQIGFSSYLQSEQFQQILSGSMQEIFADSDLQQQLADAMQKVLTPMMEGYSTQIAEVLQSKISTVMQQMSTQIQGSLKDSFSQLGSQMENALKFDAEAFQNAIQFNMTEQDLSDLMRSSMTSSSASYDGNLQSLGYADFAKPSAIYIYPKDFESKALIVDELDLYNNAVTANGEDDKVIRYTDLVGTMMTSVTEIINMISNMLIAFVSISLVVSSIMIGVITYISVLERRKEIGILRAMGASKSNVSQVFNAETFIIGLCSGCIGVGLSLLLLIPGNMIIRALSDSATITAALPLDAGLMLIILATLLTMLGGLFPAKSASKCDPVKALRSE